MVQFSHTGHWIFNTAPHSKELSEDVRNGIVALHKDGLGHNKIPNTLDGCMDGWMGGFLWVNRWVDN